MMETFKKCCGLLVLIIAASVGAFAQTQSDQDRAGQQAIRALHARDIPEATLPSTPDATAWWQDLRAAGKAVSQSRGGKNEAERLVRLVKIGAEKSYEIPVPDRYAIVLWRAAPEYTEQARRRKLNGSVAMAIQLRPDGTVGEVKIVESLDPGLDQMAINAARSLLFLPRIKDRKFVASWMPMTMSFNIY